LQIYEEKLKPANILAKSLEVSEKYLIFVADINQSLKDQKL
jgi:hypothetical protein